MPIRIGPLELVMILVCALPIIVLIVGGGIYLLVKNGTKAGIKAAKEDEQKNNNITTPGE